MHLVIGVGPLLELECLLRPEPPIPEIGWRLFARFHATGRDVVPWLAGMIRGVGGPMTSVPSYARDAGENEVAANGIIETVGDAGVCRGPEGGGDDLTGMVSERVRRITGMSIPHPADGPTVLPARCVAGVPIELLDDDATAMAMLEAAAGVRDCDDGWYGHRLDTGWMTSVAMAFFTVTPPDSDWDRSLLRFAMGLAMDYVDVAVFTPTCRMDDDDRLPSLTEPGRGPSMMGARAPARSRRPWQAHTRSS